MGAGAGACYFPEQHRRGLVQPGCRDLSVQGFGLSFKFEDLGFQIAGFGFRVSGFGFLVSVFSSQVSGLGSRV